MLSLFINNSSLYQHVVVPHTLVGFEARRTTYTREVSDWERAHVYKMQSSPFCGKASPTSWGRVESASSSL